MQATLIFELAKFNLGRVGQGGELFGYRSLIVRSSCIVLFDF